MCHFGTTNLKFRVKPIRGLDQTWFFLIFYEYDSIPYSC